MERFLFYVTCVIIMVATGLIYGYGETKEFDSFASDFEKHLSHNGGTQFLDDVYYEKLTSKYKLFRYTDTYKSLEEQYQFSISENKDFFNSIK